MFFIHVLCLFNFRYWRYSEEMKTMDPGYPKPITIWKGIPESPQGAFVHKENGTQHTHFLAPKFSILISYCFMLNEII